MTPLDRFRHALRQWSFPPAFRLPPPAADDATEELVAALAAGASVPAPTPVPMPPAAPRPPVPESEPPLADGFVVGLCNLLHRLRRTAGQMGRDAPSREVRNLDRTLRDLGELLADQALECLDLTDHPHDVGDARFEPTGGEESAGLVRPTITYCERPAVLHRGRLLQPARGIVGRPPSSSPTPGGPS